MLETRTLSCGYGDVPVLHGVSLSIEAGQCVGVFGANGVGKSTLMKALSRSLPVRGGSIIWKGRDITTWSASDAARAGIGYVPQEGNVFAELTVKENLDISADAHPAGRSLVAKYSEQFPVLMDRSRQRAGTLSGGERQILALVAALVMQPEIVLLDEPTTGLAPLIVQSVSGMIADIVAEGIGVVWVVEQDPLVALKAVDKACFMAGGELVGEYAGAELEEKHVLNDLFGLNQEGRVS